MNGQEKTFGFSVSIKVSIKGLLIVMVLTQVVVFCSGICTCLDSGAEQTENQI